MSTATVVWGRGPAIEPLAASLLAAGISVREIWYQDAISALPEMVKHQLACTVDGVPLIGEVNSSARVLERLDGLPQVHTIAEVFYTKMIGRQILDRVKVINIHPAPLPRYRGAHPLPWQIIRGETESAVTFHLAEAEIDAGPIIDQVPFRIDESDDYSSVLDKVCAIIRMSAGSMFAEFACGQLSPRSQDHEQATYVVKRTPQDGWISWRQASRDVRNFVRALTAPLPGAWSLWNGQKVIFDAVEVDERFAKYTGRTPGQVAMLGGTLGVLTADSAVLPRRIRDAESGRDVTKDLRINDRFTSPLVS
jgi:methionyl-tRNA formyltransferase